jgi:decaprenylphospho-beta-D-ribofuranose 2-oxidase
VDNLVRTSEFISFDGNARLSAQHQRPDRFAHLEKPGANVTRIARGGGYSYCAASFGTDCLVQEMTAFNRFIAFDEDALTLTVEPGVRLSELLAWALPRQLYLPVLPGYPLITVGGCIAADVHGKNPYRDGTFADWVRELTLFHPQKGYLTCSPGEDEELFRLTCGGFGLTGVITEATLQLVPLPGSALAHESHFVPGLTAARQQLAATDADTSYTWHDATPGRGFGRGLLHCGRWEQGSGAVELPGFRPMTARSRASLPLSLWNRFTGAAANTLLLQAGRRRRGTRTESLYASLFPFALNPLFHRFFGRPGLREVQLLLDDDRIDAFLVALENLVQTTSAPTMMLSLKRFRGGQTSLSATGTGYLVAIDCHVNRGTDPFLAAVDRLCVEFAAQPNLSKDSRLPRDIAQRCLRHYDAFRDHLYRFDQDRLLRSELSSRIGLL